MPKQRVPQIFTLIRFYVNPLILIPSIQHEKSDYLFQDNRFFLSDPFGIRIKPFLLAEYQALSFHYQSLPIFSCSVLFE